MCSLTVVVGHWPQLGTRIFSVGERSILGRQRSQGKLCNLDQNWEWLHIQGAQIGGQTVAGNLVAGVYATNSMMIPYETLVAEWARQDPHQFMAKFDARSTAGGFASLISISIQAKDHKTWVPPGGTR